MSFSIMLAVIKNMNKLYLFLFPIILSSCIARQDNLVTPELSSSYYSYPILGFIVYCPNGNFMREYSGVPTNPFTFNVISHHIGRDKQDVFYKSHVLNKGNVDIESFTETNNVLKDKNNVYFVKSMGRGEYFLAIVPDADASTFHYLEPSGTNERKWAQDKFRTYFYHELINVDRTSFKILSDERCSDKDSIYHFSKSLGVRGIKAIKDSLAINQTSNTTANIK